MSVIKLTEIKEEVRNLLTNYNSDSVEVRDLSQNLSERVKKVMTLNPEIHQIQPSQIPFVTVWINSKSVEQSTMAKNQLNVLRRADIEVSIAGVVFNNAFTTYDEDNADDDCENLMENIEQILRVDPTLNGKAIYTQPRNIRYHNLSLNEETHYRIGIMELNVVVFY